MTITTEPLAGLTIDDLSDHLTSSIGTDTIIWSDSNYVANPFGTYSSGSTVGPTVSGPTTMLGGTGYTYTVPNTVPWINTTTTGTGTLKVEAGGGIEIQGEGADIKINGKSMVTWMEKVEERLNILTPSPELEKDWDDLRRLGNRYRALEKKCREKAQMWAALKKVQPKQS